MVSPAKPAHKTMAEKGFVSGSVREARRQRRSKKRHPSATGKHSSEAKRTKLDQLIDSLSQSQGASIAELMALTGWQTHSVRGALAGSLKRKGHLITSSKIDGVRRYRIEAQP